MPKTKAKTNPEAKICEAALRLVARHGWNRVTLDDIARAAKMPPAQMKKLFADKTDLLPAIVRKIDSRMAEAAGKSDSQATPHDRLFEILMARMDALQAHRRAILSIMDAARHDPRMVRRLMPAQITAMRGVLKQAGLKHDRIREPFVIAGLLGVYGVTLCVWRSDSSSDMSKTMATLDRALRRAAILAEILLRQRMPF